MRVAIAVGHDTSWIKENNGLVVAPLPLPPQQNIFTPVHFGGGRRLGFSPHAYVEAFEETELRFEATGGGAERIRAQTAHVDTIPCHPLPEDASCS